MNKKRSFLAILLIFVMCFALVLSGCNQAGDEGKSDDDKSKDKDSTNNQVVDSVDKTLGALLGQDNVSDVIEKIFEGGKVTVEIDGVLQNVLYMDAEGGRFADFLKIQSQGQSMDLNLYLDGGELAVEFPMLLGDQAYGVNFGTLEQDLKNSEIWSLLGMSFEEVQSQLGFDFNQIFDALEGSMDAVGDMSDAFADALDGFKTTQEEGTVTINGTEVKAINIKCHVTSQDIYKMMETFLNEYEKLMKDMMNSVAGSMGMDAEQAMGQLNMDQVRQQLKQMLDEMNIQGDLVVSISPDTQYIMCVTADISSKVDGEDFAIDMDLVLGADPAKSDKYTFSLMMTAGGQTSGFTAELTRTTNGSVDTTAFKLNAVRGQEAMELMTGYLTYDNSNGAYELALTHEGDTMAFAGTFLQTDDKVDFTLDTMTMDGQTQKIGLRVCVESISSAEIPQMPNYKNILKLSKEELSNMFGGLLSGGIPGMGGSMGNNDSMEDILGDDYMEDILGDESMDDLLNDLLSDDYLDGML